MSKTKVQHVCQNCGAVFPKWSGKCEECGAWNTIVEEAVIAEGRHQRESISDGRRGEPLPVTAIATAPTARISTGLAECDRVLGGGIVPGSLILIGGDPGIGKSTLMLQVSHTAANRAGQVLYVSGEESFEQTRMRAERLGALSDDLYILAENRIEHVRKHLSDGTYAFAVVDSIQAVYSAELQGVPGSLTQVREGSAAFLNIAKRTGTPIVLVGHVTKEGAIAGPRLLEHLVDTVLYFEGEGKQSLRILRAVKNRFGSTNEIGVFEMSDAGLREVPNPSALFLNERPEGVSGSIVFPSIEGTRPVLVEVQALVGDGGFGTPRRTVTGVNPNRVSLLLAVLEKRAGLSFADRDVFVNVAGGVRLDEPAADVAIALAMASSLLEKPLPPAIAAFGEVGLAGEVRAVDRARARVLEGVKFGFNQFVLPRGCMKDIDTEVNGAACLPAAGLQQALEIALEA